MNERSDKKINCARETELEILIDEHRPRELGLISNQIKHKCMSVSPL